MVVLTGIIAVLAAHHVTASPLRPFVPIFVSPIESSSFAPITTSQSSIVSHTLSSFTSFATQSSSPPLATSFTLSSFSYHLSLPTEVSKVLTSTRRIAPTSSRKTRNPSVSIFVTSPSSLHSSHAESALKSGTYRHAHTKALSSHRRASSRRTSSTPFIATASTFKFSSIPTSTTTVPRPLSLTVPKMPFSSPFIIPVPYLTPSARPSQDSSAPDASNSTQAGPDDPLATHSGHPRRKHSHPDVAEILAITFGVAGVLVGLIILWLHLREQESTRPVSPLHRGHGGPSPAIPTMQQLAGFASAEGQIMQIGRTPSVATDVSFHSADANRTPAIAIGDSSSLSEQNPAHVLPRSVSPQELVSDNFAFTLSQAFDEVQTPPPFPTSVYMETSPSVTIGSQPRKRPDTLDFAYVESQRGSIIQALSMISASDRMSPARFSQDSRSIKSAKSVRSAITNRLRFGRLSSSSQGGQKQARKSFSASIDTGLSSPDLSNVNVLFSGSQDSIVIGMPSAPPVSYADQGLALNAEISRSPLTIPQSFLSFEQADSSNSPLRSRHEPWDSNRAHSNALHSSLAFNSAFSLAPASPSSVGVRLDSSSASMASSRYRQFPTNTSGLGETRSLANSSRSGESSRAAQTSSPSTTPSSFSNGPISALVASLTSKSLALADAMDDLEAEAIYASFPSTPDHLSHHSNVSPSSIHSRLNERNHRSPPRSVKLSPPQPSPASLDRSPSSMDISSALDQNQVEGKYLQTVDDLKPSFSQQSRLSLSIAELIGDRSVCTSLSDEILEGMDLSDGLYPSRSTSPSALTTMNGSQVSYSGETLRSDDLSSKVGSQIKAISAPQSTPDQLITGIPRVVIRSVDDNDISDMEPNLPISYSGSTASTSSSSRLALSVIPGHDETTDMIERTLFQIQQRRFGGDEQDFEDDEDELGSFEGDISFIRSPAASRRSDEEEEEQDLALYDEEWSMGMGWARQSTGIDDNRSESSYDSEMEGRLLVDGDLDNEVDLSNIAYFSYSRPLVPRQSEVAFRAIMNEGRPVDPGQVPRYSAGEKLNFAPARSSPLRRSHRAMSEKSSRKSDASVYSQQSGAASLKLEMSPSWATSVF